MRVAIIGAGAVGKWLAAVHLQAGHEVILICRNSQQAYAIKNATVFVNGLESVEEFQIHTKTWNQSHAQDFSTIDIFLVTVKAHQWPSFYKEWETVAGTYQPEHALWVAVHNGFVDYSFVASTISSQICRSVLTYGLTAIDQNCVEIRGDGEWRIEVAENEILQNKQLEWIESLRLFVNVSAENNIEPLFWRKIVLNASLNPVTALTGLTNGKAWDSPYARRIVLGLASEALMVCEQALGIHIEDMFAYIEQVCLATYHNQSSMLQDVLARRETEIDAINGAIIQLAERYAVDVKHQQAVFCLIKARK